MMNNFQFNNNHYLPISGTAIGTRVAPSCANIFMSDFEDKHLHPACTTLNSVTAGTHPGGGGGGPVGQNFCSHYYSTHQL